MSYGPPPKTPYGDQDFIKEEWSQQQPHQPPPIRPPTTLASAHYNSPARPGASLESQPMPPIAPTSYQAANNATPVLQFFADATKNLTREDIEFTSQWRRDSFYKRVLPMAAIANGAYYYFNKTKGLPHKPTRYVLLTSACYILGKLSYRDELKRRLEANPSQTPYMQTLRAALGVRSVAASGFVGENSQDLIYGDTTSQYADSYGGIQTGASPVHDRGSFAPPLKQSISSDYPQESTSQVNNYPLPSLYDGNTDDSANKPTLSYDELRARNRGFAPK